MADVKIRNLPDWLVDWYKRRAEDAGVSLEEHLRKTLHDGYFENRRRIALELDQQCDKIRARTGVLPDSTPLIREARQELEAKFDARPGRQRGGQVAGARRKSD